jgi:hypothetical protein
MYMNMHIYWLYICICIYTYKYVWKVWTDYAKHMGVANVLLMCC